MWNLLGLMVMTDTSLTERQKRELEFYEEYSKRNPCQQVNFAPVVGGESRPWNSYWHIFEVLKESFKADGERLLDFGCGWGEHSLVFAKIGYEVFGFDLSQNNIANARSLAEKYEMTDRVHFSVSPAEHLDFADEFFDVVVGVDILHHVNIGQAIAECSRILKKGGMAVFHEPVRAPVFDSLRETRLGRWLVSKEASLDRHLTEDERKLSRDDFKIIKSYDLKFSSQRFLLFSRLDRFVRPNKSGPSFLEKFDLRLMKTLPFMKSFGGVMVMVLRKE
jgi:2-polyprenyl-3-methyl-5-hydroxy-6-metoxy-1,4-benzoquinol methylase